MGEKIDNLVRMVERMPAFPNSVHRILQITSDINCAPKDLIQVIEHDPVLTIKILKLVNSPYFGLAKAITSIKHAVVYVGINTVKNLALSVATIGMLPKKNPAGFDMQKLLLHSLATAAIARRLAKELSLSEQEAADFFVAGLLHDIGKAVFAQYAPEEFKNALARAEAGQVFLHQAEQEIIGADHAQVGSMLAQSWKLPAHLTECLANHHQPERQPSLLTDAVFTANQLAKLLNVGDSGESRTEPMPAATSQRFGNRDLETLKATLGNIPQEIQQARIFMQL